MVIIMPDMTPESQSGTPAPPPTPADVLGWVAAAAPRLWFPGRHAEQTGIPRDLFDPPLWSLRQAELVRVGDWVAGIGQGFVLTAAGEQSVGRPDPLPVAHPVPPASAEPDDPLRTSPRSESAAGETARRSILDPAPAVITPLLLMANVVWFVCGGYVAVQTRGASDYLMGGTDPVVDPILLRVGAVSGSKLLAGDWWRLVTCNFVHVGLPHLAGNTIILGLVGTAAEGVWGRWRFALVYLLAGVAGSMTAMAVGPQTVAAGAATDTVLGGASGGLWGVTAAVVVWVLKHMTHLPPAVGADWVRKLTVVLVMTVVVSFAPGVSFEAHLGGAAAGVALAVGLAHIRGHRRESAVAVGGLTAVVLTFAALLAVAMAWSDDWCQVKERHAQRQPPADTPAARP